MQNLKTAVSTAVLALLLLPAAGSRAASNADAAAIEKDLFGASSQPGVVHACFRRNYTEAHLKGHPEQNVTDMLLFVHAYPDAAEMGQYGAAISVRFREVGEPFMASGGCGVKGEGKPSLGCGIDCDGGAIGVRLKNADSVLVDIPNGARVSSMTEFEDPDAEEGELPQGAKFGPDDKLFRLDRTDARDCLPIVYDEEIKRQIGAAQ